MTYTTHSDPDGTFRIGPHMRELLQTLDSMPGNLPEAPSILNLAPGGSNRIHQWHYNAVHRLAKHNLVELIPSGKGNNIRVKLTQRGAMHCHLLFHCSTSKDW